MIAKRPDISLRFVSFVPTSPNLWFGESDLFVQFPEAASASEGGNF